MWIALHEQTIFVSSWFTLVAIDNEITRVDALRSETPFCSGRETCATAPEHRSGSYFVVHFIGWAAECSAQTLITISRQVTRQRV